MRVARDVNLSDSTSAGGACHVILNAIADGTVVVGTVRTLTRSWGLSAASFKTGLRLLLENDQIAVQAGPGGQLSIRLSTRAFQPLPSLPPAQPVRHAATNSLTL